MQGDSLYHFYGCLWYDPAGRRTHDLPCERRTRYRLSQPDTVVKIVNDFVNITATLVDTLITHKDLIYDSGYRTCYTICRYTIS